LTAVELRLEVEPAAHGAFGIVLGDLRHREERHQPVTDELVDRPAGVVREGAAELTVLRSR
jgi:hypothetical protein